MLASCLRLSATLHRYLLLQAPSNRLIAGIRTYRRTRMIVAAGLASAMYLALAALGAAAWAGGAGWIDAVVGLLIWDSFKFAWVGLLTARTPGNAGRVPSAEAGTGVV